MNTGIGALRVARTFVTASVAAAVLLLGVAASASAGTLDQQQTAFGMFTNAGLFNTQSAAQTFTAGITGRVDQVDLLLFKTASPPDPVTVEIRDVAGGTPGNTVLASASIPISAIGATEAFLPATFATPAAVTAGSQYALVAYTTNVTNDVGWFFQQATDPYPRGEALNSGQPVPPSGDWNKPPGDDFAFKTYVVPSPPVPPATHTKKCKKHKKKHKRGAEIAKKKKCKRKKHRH